MILGFLLATRLPPAWRCALRRRRAPHSPSAWSAAQVRLVCHLSLLETGGGANRNDSDEACMSAEEAAGAAPMTTSPEDFALRLGAGSPPRGGRHISKAGTPMLQAPQVSMILHFDLDLTTVKTFTCAAGGASAPSAASMSANGSRSSTKSCTCTQHNKGSNQQREKLLCSLL